MVVNFILKSLYIIEITKENSFHFLVRLLLFTVEPYISLLLRFKSILFHSRAASSISNPTFRSSPLQISKMDGNGGSIKCVLCFPFLSFLFRFWGFTAVKISSTHSSHYPFLQLSKVFFFCRLPLVRA